MKFNIKIQTHAQTQPNVRNFLFRFDGLVSAIECASRRAPKMKICFFSSYLFLCANSDYTNAYIFVGIKPIKKPTSPRREKRDGEASEKWRKIIMDRSSMILHMPLWKIGDTFFFIFSAFERARCHSLNAMWKNRLFRHHWHKHYHCVLCLSHFGFLLHRLGLFFCFDFSLRIWIMSIAIYKSNLNAWWIAMNIHWSELRRHIYLVQRIRRAKKVENWEKSEIRTWAAFI